MNESSVVSVRGEYHGAVETLDAVILELHPSARIERLYAGATFYSALEVFGEGFVQVSVFYTNGTQENSAANISILVSSPTTDCRQLVDRITEEAGIKVLQKAVRRGPVVLI